MSNKLKIKDLVTIGIFAVIYFIIMMAAGMIQTVPVLLLAFPALNALLQGVIIMLFMAKVPKKWALFILGVLPPIVMMAFGSTYVVIIHALIFISLGEFFFRKGEFKSFKNNALAHAFMSCWTIGNFLQMIVIHDQYMEIIKSMMTEEYALMLEKIITIPNAAMAYVGAFVFGLLGAFIGKKMLKKHFEKAGII